MTIRLRQICLVAEKLDPVIADLKSIFGLEVCFVDKGVGGDQVTESKPSPEIYLKAARILGIAPSDCLGLEDSPNGVRSAVSAGMTVVQIPDLVQPDEELLKLGHVVLGSLADVLSHPF